MKHSRICWSLLTCATLLLCLLVYSGHNFIHRVANADTLLPISYIWDVRHHDYAWVGFELPRIPSIVPDLISYAVLALLFEDYRWIQFAYSFLQCLAFVIISGVLIRRLADGRTVDAAFVFLTLLSAVLVIDLAVPSIDSHFRIFVSVSHFGSFLMSLVGAALVLSLMDRWRTSQGVLFFLCCLLSFLSNRKFLFDFVLPSGTSLLVLLHFRLLSWRRAVGLVVCALFGVLLAVVADRFLARQPNMELEEFTTHILAFLTDTSAYLKSVAVSAVISLLIPYAVFVALPFVWWRRRRSAPRGASNLTSISASDDLAPVFLWTSAASSIVYTIAAGSAVYVDQGSYRYFAPAVFWPIIFCAIAIVPFVPTWIVPVSLSFLVATLSAIIVTTAGVSGLMPRILKWRHPLATCLLAEADGLGLKAGLSEYWLARPVTIDTNWAIQVDQITEDGHPYYWGNNKFSYHKSHYDPKRAPEYNFIVTEKLNLGKIRERLGTPDRIASCGIYALWIYNNPSALRQKLMDSP